MVSNLQGGNGCPLGREPFFKATRIGRKALHVLGVGLDGHAVGPGKDVMGKVILQCFVRFAMHPVSYAMPQGPPSPAVSITETGVFSAPASSF